MSNIGDLANSIFEYEFDSTGVSLTSISGWLSENIGELNNLLYTSFSGVNGEIPDLKLEEQNIYKELYLYNFYTKQARNTLRGILDNSSNILSIEDGEQTINFVNRNEVAKVYRGLAQDAQNRLEKLVYAYQSYTSHPRQVGGIEANLPSTGVFY